MKKISLGFVVLFIMIFSMAFLTSCSNDSKSDLKKVRLNEVTHSIFYAPQYIAMGLGYFSEVGIDLELKSGEGSDKTMTAVLSSGADIGLLGSSAVISVCSQGKEDCPIMFSGITQRDGSFLVGRTPEFKWEDLKGKKIIAGRKGGVPEMTLEYILSKRGIKPNEDVKLLNNIQFNLMSIAFSRGIGDYVALFEPTASTLVREKNFYILKPLGAECEKVTYTCYCCSRKYMENNPEIIQRFTRALYKAQIWVKTHSAEEAAKVIAPYFLDADISLLTLCIDNYFKSDVWCDSPIIDREPFNLIQEIMIHAGELENKVDFDKVVENKYAVNSVKNMNR